jgi:poly(A) polymerase
MKKERIGADGLKSFRSRLQQYPEKLIRALLGLERSCGRLYLAGGTVRDWLLRRPSADLDLVVKSGAASCCRFLLQTLGGGALVTLGEPGDDAARAVWNGLQIDITGFRGGSESIEDDLRRRDFTINAMAFCFDDLVKDTTEPALIDPLGGHGDLERGVLQACDRAFINDPLRMLRGYRLSAVLSFALSASTRNEIAACSPLIAGVAVERISHELDLIMESEQAQAALSAMAESGILWQCIPELQSGLGVEQPGFHHLDVFYHSLAALGSLEEVLRQPERFFPGRGQTMCVYTGRKGIRKLLKWSALLHDLGKPYTMEKRPEGRVTFYNHDRIGKEIFLRLAGRLKWSNEARDLTGSLIELHMHPFHLCNVRRKFDISKRACLKIWKKAGENLPGLFLLAMADSLACQGERKPEGMEEELATLFDDLQVIIDRAIRPVIAGPRLVTGRDLIELFSLTPGPVFATIFSGLELAMIEGLVGNRKEALDWVGQYLQNKKMPEDTP